MQDRYSQIERPFGLYARIYVHPEIASEEDLNVWVRELNNPIDVFATKISGAMDSWYVTCPALLSHLDIPLMLNGSGLEKNNARIKIENDTNQFIREMNVGMAIKYATLPVYFESFLILSPDEPPLEYRTVSLLSNSSRNSRHEIVSSMAFKGFEPKKRVDLLLSKFFLTGCNRNDAERYSAIYQVIEVAERLVGKKTLAKNLGDDKSHYEELRMLANNYRHAISDSADRKERGRLYDEAAILKKIVRTALKNMP